MSKFESDRMPVTGVSVSASGRPGEMPDLCISKRGDGVFLSLEEVEWLIPRMGQFFATYDPLPGLLLEELKKRYASLPEVTSVELGGTHLEPGEIGFRVYMSVPFSGDLSHAVFRTAGDVEHEWPFTQTKRCISLMPFWADEVRG